MALSVDERKQLLHSSICYIFFLMPISGYKT